MEESEKTTLMKTKWTILRNLDCINEYVDANGLPIEDHMILDDIKDSLKSLRCIKELVEGNGEQAAKMAVKAVPGMV